MHSDQINNNYSYDIYMVHYININISFILYRDNNVAFYFVFCFK